MSEAIAERDALYYPYVHFPSEAWLKSALLFTPHVYRMVASEYQPRHDTEFMKKIREVETNGVPLLEHANLYSETALRAQRLLMQRLRTDIDAEGPAFKGRFNKAAARRIATDAHGFQMHPGKLTGNLISNLEDLELAWTPDHPDDKEYRELHPAIGGAFLGSVAIACAVDVGLAVVGEATDTASKELNRLALTCDFEAVYDEFVHGKKPLPGPRSGSADAIADIILFNHCDASALTIEDLKDLAKEREPIRELKAKLREFAAEIPPLLDEAYLERKLQEKAAAALEKWQGSRPSFRGALKKFFGAELAKVGVDLLKGSISKASDLTSKPPASGLAVSAGGAALYFLGPIAGFGVGLAVHGVTTAVSELTREKESPYRYLSMAEKAGVVFSVGGTAAQEAKPKTA
jgi:hypothetical protein